MPQAAVKYGIVLAVVSALLAVLWQIALRDLFIVTLGVTRHLQPISDFPYQCRRIQDPIIQACEDMWLSESSRQLFLACSDPLARKQWMPNVQRLNASGRPLDDAFIVMDIDTAKGDSYQYRILDTPNYSGVNGDGALHLVGFTGVDSTAGINLFIVNARPSIDATSGELLDNAKVGGNSTIERFVLAPPQASELKHVSTFAHPQIATPNNIAAVGKNAFYFTNDHGPYKVGLQHHLSPVIGTGDVSYCTTSSGCRQVARGHKFPNGLLVGKDGTLYIPESAGSGGIHVYRRTDAKGNIEKVDYIPIPYPLDNLSQDSNGDIFAAALPAARAMLSAFDNPLGPTPASTIIRVRRKVEGEGWEWQKVLEDANGEVLPGTTTAIHDAKTGRFFLSGVFSPFITVCEKQ